jgi:hypothetical protein
MSPWLIITGFGLDDWIYEHLLVQSLIIIINYNNSQSIFSRTLLPWLPRTLSIPVLVLRLTSVKVKSQSYIATDGRSISKSGFEPHLGLMTRYLLLFDSYGLVFVRRPFWREDRSVYCICCWVSPAQSFSGPSPLDLETIFYCLSFETSLFVASYDSQGHGGYIRPPLTSDLRLDYLIVSRRIHRKHISCPVMDIFEPHRKHFFLYCCIHSPLRSNGSYPIVFCEFVVAGMCLRSCCPGTGQHVTIFRKRYQHLLMSIASP